MGEAKGAESKETKPIGLRSVQGLETEEAGTQHCWSRQGRHDPSTLGNAADFQSTLVKQDG